MNSKKKFENALKRFGHPRSFESIRFYALSSRPNNPGEKGQVLATVCIAKGHDGYFRRGLAFRNLWDKPDKWEGRRLALMRACACRGKKDLGLSKERFKELMLNKRFEEIQQNQNLKSITAPTREVFATIDAYHTFAKPSAWELMLLGEKEPSSVTV